ncbi:MAG: SDR family NAD(P)-dependent oxidoreductase [Rhodocyclaceae bacterium]|nr:SDR family NAD(P)-dependent oxidoreductase [Rhodocyclaceae bacterium]
MTPAQTRIVVIGAAGAIGRCCVAALAVRGASLLLVDRPGSGVDALAAQTAGSTALVTDATSTTGRAGIVAAARALDANALLYAAGVPVFGPLEALDEAQLETSLRVNLMGPLLLTRDLLPVLSAQPEAHVIWLGSTLGRIGIPGFAAYSAGKFGLRGAAEALRREWGDGPVRIHHIAPRAVRTAFNAGPVETYNQATGTASDPPEVVAEAVCAALAEPSGERFLGSPERFAAPLNGFAPGLLDGAFVKHRKALRALGRADPPAAGSAPQPLAGTPATSNRKGDPT